jgi:3-phenylpropionate/trans-cinnamate dioxygenase ferredoxin subunit
MERIRVASLADLAPGAGRLVEWAGRRLALFLVEGEVFALADRCSHAEASLAEGEVFGHTVECPRHGAAFDLRTGETLSLPATRGVAAYRVEVEGDAVYLWAGTAGEGAS